MHYVVGTTTETLLESHPDFFTCDTSGPEFHTPRVPLYYIDTRNLEGYGRFDNYFSSTLNVFEATAFGTYEDAVAWRNEFLEDCIIYCVH